MPFYTFKCDKCNIEIEKRMPLKSKECPNCERCGNPTRKALSLTNFRFKGALENNKHKMRNVIIKEE